MKNSKFQKLFTYIGAVNSSAKIAKGEKINLDTYCIYLAPYKLSGFNVCAKATQGCIDGCLNESGQAIMTYSHIINSRIAKTKAFYSDRPAFINQVYNEISRAYKKAVDNGRKFCVRLNGTSDLSPELFKIDGKTLLELFPKVDFYDYTKISNRFRLAEKFKNYFLTFSYSGENWTECETVLKQGGNVSVVFNVKRGKELPTHYKGFQVIDGDINDYRPADPAGCIVGLRFKRIKDSEKAARALASGFIVSI